MNKLLFEFKKTAGFDKELIATTAARMHAHITRLAEKKNAILETDYAFMSMPEDHALQKEVARVVAHKKKLSPSILVVIGIGGSNLGTRAVQEFLLGSLYNQTDPACRVYYVDTVDADYVTQVTALVEAALARDQAVICNVITKSGTTLESIANFSIFLALFKQHKPADWHHYFVITTDAGSALEQFAQEYSIDCLAIPHKLGGRYSVLSAVGLFPLAMLEVDVVQLCAGAADMTQQSLQVDEKNSALISAAIIFLHYHATHKKNIHDMFLFSLDAEFLGKWYRQLLAESVGKAFDAEGKKVHVNLTPTVSIGTSDLHSVAQLYLAALQDRFTTFLTVQTSAHKLIVPEVGLNIHVPVSNISFDRLMNAAAQSMQHAYAAKNQPFVTITLPEKSAYAVGQFLQFKMFEVVYLAELLNVNAFDQPNVQEYKKELENILHNNL